MKKYLSTLTLIIGFLAGASALSALAATSTWTAPSAAAPNGNVAAPVNVGSVDQSKDGALTLNFAGADQIGLKVLGQIQMVDGSQGAGKVLTSDATGVATWQTTAGAYFVTPNMVYSNAGANFPTTAPGLGSYTPVPWTTFDASPYIPAGSSAVILETSYAQSGPDNGYNSIVWTRSNSSGAPIISGFGRCAGNADNCGGSEQSTVPVSSSRTFDYKVEVGFNKGLQIRLIGYIGPALSNLTAGTLACSMAVGANNTTYTFSGAPTGGTGTYSYNFHMNVDPYNWPINSATNIPGSLTYSNSSPYSNQHGQRLDVTSANSTVSVPCQ